MMSPRPNPIIVDAGTRYTNWWVPATYASANAMPRNRNRYAPASLAPRACMSTPNPTARRTAPPRMPRPPVIPRMVGRSLVGDLTLEPGQRDARREMVRRIALQRFRVFEPAAGVDDEDVLVRVDEALHRELMRTLERGGALGTHEEPFAHRGESHHRGDLVVGHLDRDAARLAEDPQHQEIAEGLGHPDAGGERRRIGPRLRLELVGVERLDDRRAPARLHRDEPRELVVLHPADLAQLLGRLPHADEPAPATGRIDDHVGKGPAGLLSDLEAHRLLAFDAVRLLQRRGVEPAVVR